MRARKALSLILFVCVCGWEEGKSVDMRQAGKERWTECGNCKMGAGRAKEDDAAGLYLVFVIRPNPYAVSYGLVCA